MIPSRDYAVPAGLAAHVCNLCKVSNPLNYEGHKRNTRYFTGQAILAMAELAAAWI